MANKRKRLEQEQKALAIAKFRSDSLRKAKARLKAERNSDPIEEFCSWLHRTYGSGFEPELLRWKRPKTKDKDRLRQNLARFIFEKYPAPRFLRRSFCGISDERSIDCLSRNQRDTAARWYIAVAQGRSLKDSGLAKMLTKKEIHAFLTVAPSNGTINGNLWWTRAHTFGGRTYADLIVGSRLMRNEFGRCARFDFWVDVLRFFANNPAEHLDDFNDYLDFLAQNQNIISMRGRNLRNLALRRDEWHMRLYQSPGTNVSWRGVDIPNTRLKIKSKVRAKGGENSITYEFWQIKNGKDLRNEGRLMNHCVSSYRNQCIDGICSIWSVVEKTCSSDKGRHVATIELVSDERIVQARGIRNSVLAGTVKSAIMIWAKGRSIELSPYLF